MNIKFEPKVDPAIEVTEKILVSGKFVGKIYVDNGTVFADSRYMAELAIPKLSPVNKLYGHGATRIEAVVNALEVGKKDTSLVLKFINKMESDLAQNS